MFWSFIAAMVSRCLLSCSRTYLEQKYMLFVICCERKHAFSFPNNSLALLKVTLHGHRIINFFSQLVSPLLHIVSLFVTWSNASVFHFRSCDNLSCSLYLTVCFIDLLRVLLSIPKHTTDGGVQVSLAPRQQQEHVDLFLQLLWLYAVSRLSSTTFIKRLEMRPKRFDKSADHTQL